MLNLRDEIRNKEASDSVVFKCYNVKTNWEAVILLLQGF